MKKVLNKKGFGETSSSGLRLVAGVIAMIAILSLIMGIYEATTGGFKGFTNGYTESIEDSNDSVKKK